MLGPLRRGMLVFGWFLLQFSMIILTAAVMQASMVTGDLDRIEDDMGWCLDIPVSLLGLQAAGLVVASRTLTRSETPDIRLISLLYDTFTDQLENAEPHTRMCEEK